MVNLNVSKSVSNNQITCYKKPMNTKGIVFHFTLISTADDWSEDVRITDIENKEMYAATAGAIYDRLVASLEARRKKNEKPNT